MSRLRVGLIGCKNMGGTHAPHYGNHPEGMLAAACDLDEGLAHHVAGEFGAPHFTDYRRMLDSVSLDAVDICTPPNTHLPIALDAISRGLHVLCEKPLARSSEEAREMVSAARERGVLLMTAFCHRFHPPIMAAKELIARGEIGRVLMLRNRFGGKLVGMENRWFSQPEISGGGVLVDTAIHSVDLFRFLAGEVRQVRSFTATFNPAIREVEDSAVMILEGEGGALGVIEASWATPDCVNAVEIYGSSGAILYSYDTGEIRYRVEGSNSWKQPDLPTRRDRFAGEIDHFLRAIRGQVPLSVTGEDGLRALEILEQAR